MATSNQVVARYKDGRVVKGTSLDLDPAKPTFHIRPPSGAALEIKLADLKALYFVKSLEGDPIHKEGADLDPKDPRLRGSTPVRLRFADGETLVGLTNRYPPNRPYFYVVPVDLKSNNIRILVNRLAVTSIEATGPASAT